MGTLCVLRILDVTTGAPQLLACDIGWVRRRVLMVYEVQGGEDNANPFGRAFWL